MRSARSGTAASGAEVTDVTRRGFRLRVCGRAHRLAFRDFPWFREATIAELTNVVCEGPDHLRWPDLDIDLSVESIEHPERFPLVSGAGPGGSAARRRRATGTA